MEIDNIWIDVKGNEGESEGKSYSNYFTDNKYDEDYDSYASESDDIREDHIDSSVPEEMLDFFLSSERINRQKQRKNISLRNISNNTISTSNTRRNINRSHQITPKRKMINKSNRGVKKKTKKIIYLKN